ncbi:Cas9 inhibitor AcrIIA9 family protein, partial [Sharpea azabuensis]
MKFEDDLMKYRHDAAISYLGQLLKTREDIKVQLAKPNKDLGECMNYLMSCARKKVKGQCAVLSDDEALSMAIHYYDEDDIVVDRISGSVSASPVQDEEHEQGKNEDIEKIVSERVEKEVARIKEEVSRSNQEDVEKIVSERVQN